jgi:hypothetical protein
MGLMVLSGRRSSVAMESPPTICQNDEEVGSLDVALHGHFQVVVQIKDCQLCAGSDMSPSHTEVRQTSDDPVQRGSNIVPSLPPATL